MLKKIFYLIVILLGSSSTLFAQADESITVTDLAGRTVTLDQPANKVLLGEGRFIAVLSVLGIPQPATRIAGMLNEFKLYDPDSYAAFKAVYPEIDEVATYGHTSVDSISIEKMLLLNPDLAIFGLSGHGPDAKAKHIIDKLTAAGIPVVFIDFRQDPINNTAKSVELIGQLMGFPDKAKAFSDFYNGHLKVIAERVQKVAKEDYPKVLIDLKSNSESECCLSVAKGLFADMVSFSGGQSLAAGFLKGPVGQLNHEYILTTEFDVFMGTAVGANAYAEEGKQFLLTGAGVTKEDAQASLKNYIDSRQFNDLTAVQQGRAYTLWHHFYNSPLNLYAIEKMATWFHPELFTDLNPEETLKTLLSGAMPVDLSGTYSATLNKER